MGRQALRVAVTRYNAEGLSGLDDRSKPGRPPGLTEGEEATLAALILRGPDPEHSGISAHTRDDIAALIAQHFGKHDPAAGLSKVLWRMGFSRQKGRVCHRWWLRRRASTTSLSTPPTSSPPLSR
jgi:transposase